MIYDEAIGGLVITGKTYCIYIYQYKDVTLYLSQSAKAEKVFETTQYYQRCSSRKLNFLCR